MSEQEQTPAYRALYEKDLICNQYRVRHVADLDLIRGRGSITQSKITQCVTCNGCCCLMSFFVVNSGCVRRGAHADGRYLFFGEGVHILKTPYVTAQGDDVSLTQASIVHGTRAIVTIGQGYVGLAMDRGQPVLLPPGLHQWDSPTIEFHRTIDLSSSLIQFGPYTLVTVDEGYAAVTQDNGEQKILDGGRAYMLTHRNWKFEKFMTKKLQTNDVGPISVTTGDNVSLDAVATVNWSIEDARLAARMAASTMAGSRAAATSDQGGQFDIGELQQDVIRQVKASLAAFIGTVNYSAHKHITMAARVEGSGGREADHPDADPDSREGRRALFERGSLSSSLEHANENCRRYGVKILSINLISATPADRTLLDAFSQGAMATVAAEQTATRARGEATALLSKAEAEAEAARIRAAGEAEAEKIRAQGSLLAARELEGSELAKELARLRGAGECLKGGKASSFFFGLPGASDIPGGLLGTALLADTASSRA